MSIVEQAKYELKKINFGIDDTAAMIAILELFFRQWDSGAAVSVAAPVLQRLLAGKPLSLLTGKDDEWVEVSEHEGRPLFQNKRCSTVFKTGDEAWDIDIDRPEGQSDWVRIKFPYLPTRARVQMPIYEVGSD